MCLPKKIILLKADFTQTYHQTKHQDLEWIWCYITAQECTDSMLVALV